MKIISIFILLLSAQSYADSCMKESDLFMDLVAVKWGVNSNIEKDPNRYTDEKWEYVYSFAQDVYKKGKISAEKAGVISKLIANNDFSDNPEVEVNIFEDYWLLSCRNLKNGVKSAPLAEISKDALIGCWNTASSRMKFQECMSPLLSKQS